MMTPVTDRARHAHDSCRMLLSYQQQNRMRKNARPPGPLPQERENRSPRRSESIALSPRVSSETSRQNAATATAVPNLSTRPPVFSLFPGERHLPLADETTASDCSAIPEVGAQNAATATEAPNFSR